MSLVLIPARRHSFFTGVPLSASLNTAMICFSVNRPLFMSPSPLTALYAEKLIPAWIKFGGAGQAIRRKCSQFTDLYYISSMPKVNNEAGVRAYTDSGQESLTQFTAKTILGLSAG
jgi:hypothetical protein